MFTMEGLLSIKTQPKSDGTVEITIITDQKTAENFQKIFSAKMNKGLNQALAEEANSKAQLFRAQTRQTAEEKRLTAVKDYKPVVEEILFSNK